MSRTGVLPSQTLRHLIEIGVINDIDPMQHVKPASIDLPLTEIAFRLDRTFQLREGEKVRAAIERCNGRPHDLRHPLELNIPYVIKVAGTHHLLPNMYGYINPKSSVGRLNLFCRVVADGVEMYDALTPEGWNGEIWVLAKARSFPILLSPGQALSQLRLFDGKTFLDQTDMNIAIREYGLIFDKKGDRIPVRQHAGSLLLTLHVEEGATGWECRGAHKVLDYGKFGSRGHYDAEDFFEPVKVRDGWFEAREGCFYILTTREWCVVPPDFSAELRPIDPRIGDLRNHAAGFIDPGWGWGKQGEGRGRPITLEVTPFEGCEFFNGRIIARMRYEHMRETPDTLYDDAGSNYTAQDGPQLSKHFIKPD